MDNYVVEQIATMSAGAIFAWVAIAVVSLIAQWKLFEKAGEPGWASIVPLYNSYVLFKISWGNGWLFLLLLIPFADFVIWIIAMVKLAKSFGKDGGWACGLIFLNTIFICIMGLSDDIRYVGPNGVSAAGAYGNPGYGNPAYGPQPGYQNPYGAQPGYQQPPYGAQPGYQQPPYGTQPGNQQPPYGAQPGNQQPPYGAQPGNQTYGTQPNYGAQQAANTTQPAAEPTQAASPAQQMSEAAPAAAEPTEHTVGLFNDPTQTGAPKQNGVRFCENCGTRIESNEKFCPKCGTKQ